ncbi:poly-beta-1,6 N-acetyl-D-glucosamine export porin PgaA [Crenobacter luteus]|uniref:PgaA membrane beta barrel domain-containing protein n=1 Tax=Crenobacter luteus TaxID=1452487 RepID=A0A165G572_9NEIS|nr:poly-beta-1,6 N-acetyl-D-glucosamine export porin PgaA [Crenobacter luteus]KZE35139.1 hypothetical protein AVW16_05035 [Crenobacter luteus]
MPKFIVKGIAASLVCLSLPAFAAPLWKQPGYEQAIRAARDGAPSAALAMLEPLHQAGTLQQPLLDDYLTLLVWDQRGEEAIALLEHRYPPASLGQDALNTLARYQRDRNRLAQAEALYKASLARRPTATAQAGLAMTLAEAGQAGAGLALLDATPARTPADRLTLDRARAYLLTFSEEHTAALGQLETLLERHPDDPELARAYTTLLVRMGAPHQAYAYLKSRRVEAAELYKQLSLDKAATATRWGRSETRLEVGESRFRQTDAALALNEGITRSLHPEDATYMKTAIADRLVMLEQRARYRDTVALYRQHENDALPAYALAAAASAYLAEENPQEAIRLSKLAMADMPRQRAPIDWRIVLVYAHLEAEQPKEARDEVERLKQDVQRIRHDAASGQNRYNPDYQQVMLLDAMLDAYVGRTQVARAKLDTLLDDAPFNGELRQNDGELELLRGHPRTAEGIFARRLVDEPRAVEAKRGLAVAYLDTHRYSDVPALIADVVALAPESRATQRLSERWRWSNRPQLVVDAEHELSGGQGEGLDSGWTVETRLYSAPIASHWRIFARSYNARADYVGDGRVSRNTLGFGAEYRDPRWQAEAALTGSLDGRNDTGGLLALTRTFDDRFSLGLRYEHDSDEVPMRARRDNVDGKRLAAEFSYRVDDQRRFDAALSGLDLSDGNLRQRLRASWTERWIAQPTYTLDTILSAGASKNRNVVGANYFNPGKDSEVGVTVLPDWLLWRRYDTSLRHRLGLYAANYWQEGYGSKLASAVFYEHEWRWTPRAGLRYGFAHSVHPYDGDSDVSNRLYLNLDWRF